MIVSSDNAHDLPVITVAVLSRAALVKVPETATGRQNNQVVLGDVSTRAAGCHNLHDHLLAGRVARQPLHFVALAAIGVVLALVVRHLDREAVREVVRDGDRLVVVTQIGGSAVGAAGRGREAGVLVLRPVVLVAGRDDASLPG